MLGTLPRPIMMTTTASVADLAQKYAVRRDISDADKKAAEERKAEANRLFAGISCCLLSMSVWYNRSGSSLSLNNRDAL